MNRKTGVDPAKARRRLGLDLWLATLVLGVMILIALGTPLPPSRTAQASVLYDRHGDQLAILCAVNRQPIALQEVPAFLRQAVIATEDAGFYRHGGISLRGIARAAWRDLTRGRVVEGASTITQQLARSIYLSPRRTLWRKLAEMYHAFKMELKWSKDEILGRYLNEVFWGEGTYGVKAAAWAYFARLPGDLNRAEQAFLAGILQAPAAYSPWRHPEAARRRLAQVIERMRLCGYLDTGEAAGILTQELRFRKPASRRQLAPYFVSYVQSFLAELLPDGAAGVYRAGLQVQTTLDPSWQAGAETALARLEATGSDGPQGSLVALDPQTGAVRAMVGGRDYSRSPFNRVTQARRQPGSAFKAIVYADALERGYTLATLRDCQPRRFQLGADSYLPVDSSRTFAQSQLNLRDALAASCNVVAVALGAELGPAEVAGFARRLGIESTLRPYLSLAIGTSEVKPLELAAVYAAFANGGQRVVPYGVESVRTADGRVIYRAHPAPSRVIRQSTAFLLTQALGDVFGPIGTAAGFSPGRPAAGKTGTSDGNRDAWFAGYTPDLVAVVHVGYDSGRRPLPGSGGSLAAPIWTDFVRRALHGRPAQSFPVPAGVKDLVICGETGDLAGPGCSARTEYFAAGTEPGKLCERHRVVQLLVCRWSHLLPGPNCRRLESMEFKPGEEPQEVCGICRGGIFDWLENLLRQPRRRRLFPRSTPGDREAEEE